RCRSRPCSRTSRCRRRKPCSRPPGRSAERRKLLTEAQFERARRLALGLAGIEMFDRHRELLQRRSDRLIGQGSLDALLDAAADIDEAALAVAREAEYAGAALAALEPAQQARFVGEPTGGGSRRLVPAVRRLVEFRRVNLADLVWPLDGIFDVVSCRNVLMYLEAGHRYAVLERIPSMLEPGCP